MNETTWKYLAATSCQTVQAWGCALRWFTASMLQNPFDRLELPVAGAVIELCCGEAVTLQPALRPGDATRSSAFFAGLLAGSE